jgi:endonuclease-8
MVARLRGADQGRELGEALLDQRLVAGIGNMWRAEALWRAGISPWRRLGEAGDEELLRVLREAAAAMQGPRARREVYRRGGRPCRRCGAVVCSRPQGDQGRTAYWCPGCQEPVQAGTEAGGA